MYHSGSRFIDTVREVERYHPDYSQYIEKMRLAGTMKSRKVFYYNILMALEEDKRIRVVNKLLDRVEAYEPEKTSAIRDLIGGRPAPKEIEIQPSIATQDIYKKEVPDISRDAKLKVFISYSWDSKEHQLWIIELAERLAKDGIDIILDRYELGIGKNLTHFMEQAIEKADKVIIILTKNYKLKADNRSRGVGYEYSLINAELYNKQTDNVKFLPVLREGTAESSIPSFMKQFIFLDMTEDSSFEENYTELIHTIYDEPLIIKPPIGEKPDFTERRRI